MNIKNINYLKVLKIAVGSSAAIFLARAMGLSYAASAGIITLLSIRDTKKETLATASGRTLAYLASTLIALVSYQVLGFSLTAYAVYTFFFVAFCFYFHIEDAISICMVLTGHYLVEETLNLNWFYNETLLFIIGVGIGVLMNLYIPSNMKRIREGQYRIEEDMKELLVSTASALVHMTPTDEIKKNLEKLRDDIDKALSEAYRNMNNTLLKDTKYFIDYMEMRKNQAVILQTVCLHLDKLEHAPNQAAVLSNFMIHMSQTFHERNNAEGLIRDLKLMRNTMRNEPLPVTREEFENRAVLYQTIYELEDFLRIKRQFVRELSEEQVRLYWEKEA